jgi:glycogen debranching enzyme
LETLYFLKENRYFSDCLHGPAGTPARSARPDDALRPNQLFAITLDAVTDRHIDRAVLQACEQLLVPGGIRSLADRPVRVPLTIVHKGRPLNDPDRPYWGTYTGDEDTRRKPAYHNGTAWSWLLPTYCEAWAKVYGESGKKTALALLGSMVEWMNRGCLGHLPEIFDGDTPHRSRGCDAQAWGASEMLRVWTKLDH